MLCNAWVQLYVKMLPQEYQYEKYRDYLPRFLFNMPRVVADQKAKFESDDLFKRLSRDSEVRYTGFRDRPMEERRIKFRNAYKEGHVELAFVSTGTNLQLVFSPSDVSMQDRGGSTPRCIEHGKVHIQSSFIMNGVSVRWKGWLDVEKLEGVGRLEYDEHLAKAEDDMLKRHIELCNQKLKEMEKKHEGYVIHARSLRMQGQIIMIAIRNILNTKRIDLDRCVADNRREPWALFLEHHSRTGVNGQKLRYPHFLKERDMLPTDP